MKTATNLLTLSPAELEEYVARAAAEEELYQEETIAQCRRLFAASAEPGFNGDLRRAIHTSGVQLDPIADAAGMDVFALCDFLEGTAELTSGQVAAIVERLGLQLVRPIPKDEKRFGRSPCKSGK